MRDDDTDDDDDESSSISPPRPPTTPLHNIALLDTKPAAAPTPNPPPATHNNPTQEEEEEDDDESNDLLFSCRCESAKAISTLLSCLRHVSSSSATAADISFHTSTLSQRVVRSSTTTTQKKAQHATVFVTQSSLTFHVHGMAKMSQASVDMQS
eukprot:3416642-Ditylum_brightwellii.AAC.1